MREPHGGAGSCNSVRTIRLPFFPYQRRIMKAHLGSLVVSTLLSPAALAFTSEDLGIPLAELDVYYESDPGGLEFTARLHDAAGPLWGLYARLGEGENQGAPILLGYAPVGEEVGFVVPEALVQSLGVPLRFHAAYLRGGEIVRTDPADLILGVSVDPDVLDFNYTLGPDDVMVAGRVIDEQWADVGLHVSAVNSAPGHPNLALIFDSSNPTGGDSDLRTPNPGAFDNDTALGNLLIVAENDFDAGADGLIDSPDDEGAGGSLIIDFDQPATVYYVTLVDIDEVPGTELRFYRGGNLAMPDETISILSLGDGSVQRVDFLEEEVDRFEVFFRGSGGIARVGLGTCPRLVNFDETTLGVARDLSAGEEITNQFANLGLAISAVNADATHPDRAILFDSENPTGGDFDLMTPNMSAPGNTEPLGLVLIIAENDVDVAPADGLVDDPDDEAAGGVITFAFEHDVTIESAKVLDVDGAEVDTFRFFDADGAEIGAVVIPDQPDGSVQTVTPNVSGVRRAVLELGGSGAITRLRFCPEGDDDEL